MTVQNRLRRLGLLRSESRLCDAASAMYYSIHFEYSRRTGKPVVLPELLLPLEEPPRPRDYSDAELDEAELFLTRLGVVRAPRVDH